MFIPTHAATYLLKYYGSFVKVVHSLAIEYSK